MPAGPPLLCGWPLRVRCAHVRVTPGACLQGTGAHLTVPLLATCDRVLYHETLTGGVGAEELLGFFQRAAALLVNSDIEWIQWDNAPTTRRRLR